MTTMNESASAVDIAPIPPTKTNPGAAVAHEHAHHDLESDIQARRAQIIAKLAELKTDVRQEAAEERDRLKAKLSELSHLIKENVVDGWANLGANAKVKLGHWLGR